MRATGACNELPSPTGRDQNGQVASCCRRYNLRRNKTLRDSQKEDFEATGYQRDRERDELAKILEAFVAKEIQKYLRTFDLEFYELICDLRGEPLERAKKRPKYFGRITNNLVYCRLAPGVLAELKKFKDEKGKPHSKLLQGLTPEYGHPKLKEHLAGVTMTPSVADSSQLVRSFFSIRQR